MIENIQREQLNLQETAAGVAAMYDNYGNQKRVAEELGKSIPWVSKMVTVARGLSGSAYELLALNATSDIELLGIVTRIEELTNSFPRLDHLVQCIIDGKAGRKEAQELLTELKSELNEVNESSEISGDLEKPLGSVEILKLIVLELNNVIMASIMNLDDSKRLNALESYRLNLDIFKKNNCK